MIKCKKDDHIDDYLLNRLGSEKKDKFEEHYFNCSNCFEKVGSRAELISVVKNKSNMIFENISEGEKIPQTSLLERILDFLSPQQWALAAVSSALVLIIAFGVLPRDKKAMPQFFVNNDAVRGESITLISPVIDTNTAPSQFKWISLGKEVDYKIYVYNHELIWNTTTSDNQIQIPLEVKNRMTTGKKYSWQVKAFSEKGILMAVSSKVQFKINSKE